jgi:hypothetical protein
MKANRVFHVEAAIGFVAVTAWAAEPRLTIYNQNFAVVRVLIPLDLKPGGQVCFHAPRSLRYCSRR